MNILSFHSFSLQIWVYESKNIDVMCNATKIAKISYKNLILRKEVEGNVGWWHVKQQQQKIIICRQCMSHEKFMHWEEASETIERVVKYHSLAIISFLYENCSIKGIADNMTIDCI